VDANHSLPKVVDITATLPQQMRRIALTGSSTSGFTALQGWPASRASRSA
jgi:hypothetical protein